MGAEEGGEEGVAGDAIKPPMHNTILHHAKRAQEIARVNLCPCAVLTTDRIPPG